MINCPPNTVSFEWESELFGMLGHSNETTGFMGSLGASVPFIAPGSATAQGVEEVGKWDFRGGRGAETA